MASSAAMTALDAAITAAWPHTPIHFPNVAGAVPNDGSPLLIVTYPVANETMMTVGAPGANVWREEGAVRVVLSLPIGMGLTQDGISWPQRFDDLRGALRGKVFGGVVTFEATPPATNDQSDRGAYFDLSSALAYQIDITG